MTGIPVLCSSLFRTPRGAAPCDNADAHHATILGPCSDDSEDIVKEDVSENSIPIPGPSQHRAKAVDVNQEWVPGVTALSLR